jgi:thiosulfate dehydrogenase
VAGYSVERGKVVFEAQCALCHGADGLGLRTDRDHQQFPPLWGPEAYNWGAGMHRVNTAAGFIKANMPLGKADLSDQESWDVAAYINSKPRPQDPRQVETLEKNDQKNHDEDCLYGDEHEGKTLGVGVSRTI